MPEKRSWADWAYALIGLLTNLIDWITGRKRQEQDAGSASSAEQEEQHVAAEHGKIDGSSPGVEVTPEGGIDYSGFNSGNLSPDNGLRDKHRDSKG